ncbi:LLM class F420-dependent oxidoreductase [Nakamurella multipartita]|uniref:Luciferase-like domain-containing protein n=1 Tax=Nakamurella multipartita (strain ATCC 700099 / DSM 44233 / CIP 104796 / JCM 9543 / NBRC 105858 / Y-104) TaxID=479431 RepID=C8XF25_NAKMY|nr:LLM class F420-dependent oxidoreductase [Nakamurella multipartita]ACV77911.1 hypothetical protein Namu_1512 [Nakamurella multipartita DSM 44233]
MDIGRYGVWRHKDRITAAQARRIEELGYGAIWVGASPAGDLSPIPELLAATERIVIASGVINMWATGAEVAAQAYHRLAAEYPGRFLLGVGIGHRETSAGYQSPYATIVDYLDQLDAAGVPAAERVLAALGPRVLRLAGERTAGAHPYFTTPGHTRFARSVLGAGPLLAPEQKIVLDTDGARARAIARPTVEYYLSRVNYVNNLKRDGWTDEDVAGSGSDALVDALAVHGDAATLAAGLTAHLDAGADHVCAQVLTEAGGDPLPALEAVAEELGLSAAG